MKASNEFDTLDDAKTGAERAATLTGRIYVVMGASGRFPFFVTSARMREEMYADRPVLFSTGGAKKPYKVSYGRDDNGRGG